MFGQHQRGRWHIVTETEKCSGTPNQKENFEEQPDRTVDEHNVPPEVKGGQEVKFSSTGK
jgi:hypothetical protein